jgi:hypothetical protein
MGIFNLGIFAGCIQAARALGDQVIGDKSVTVVVRWGSVKSHLVV